MKVRIKPTGDTDIDKYIGQIGEVIKVEVSELTERRNDQDYAHYHVKMPDGAVVIINNSEFERVN